MLAIDELYFNWMVSKLFYDDEEAEMHLAVVREMHNTLFEYSICTDENRQKDAQDLRYKFGYEHGYYEAEICRTLDVEPPSILEVIVALIDRVQENVLCDLEKKVSNQEIFLDILKSLGIDSIVGSYALSGDCARCFENAMSMFINRTYSYYGEGGLFTVQNPKYDMRDAEIWYQFMWYLNEKLGGRYL